MDHPDLNEWLKTTLRVTNTHLNYELLIHEIGEGVVFEDADYRVTAKSLQHIIPCLGYRIEQKPLPGKLLIDKAKEAGVPNGPLLKQLKRRGRCDIGGWTNCSQCRCHWRPARRIYSCHSR